MQDQDAYSHARHAGNAGDVFKHVALAALLEALPATSLYIETHAGDGLFTLGSVGEWTAGAASNSACDTNNATYEASSLTYTTQPLASATQFQAVPELPYRVVPNFFKFPKGTIAGEASAVAVNSKGHIFLFQRTKPMTPNMTRSATWFRASVTDSFPTRADGASTRATNLRTTDDGNHPVLKAQSRRQRSARPRQSTFGWSTAVRIASLNSTRTAGSLAPLASLAISPASSRGLTSWR